MEESNEPRPEGSEQAPVPLGEETGEELEQELLSSEGSGPEIRGSQVGRGLDARRNLLPGALAAAVVAFAAVGIFVLGMFTHSVAFDDGGSTVVVPAAQGATGDGAQPTPSGPVDVSVDDDPGLGPEDAAVTIVEFSDFECPYCAKFQSETLPQIIQNYGDRVRFVYRDFPLTSLHANALKAAEASECADEQGKYWEYHDLLFQNQSALDDASLKNYAATVGLDTEAFNQCLDTDSTMSEIQKDYQDGIAAGVQGTPAFFVNGNLIEGAQPYSAFQAAIEAALAGNGD